MGTATKTGVGMDVMRKRFEIEAAAGGPQGEVFDYLRTTRGNGDGGVVGRSNVGGGVGGEWEDEGPSEEVFLQRALVAIKTASQRGDGIVEMEEREWQAWKLHEAMEAEIEKRVAEREMEREMQRERDLARAEELQRELDILRIRTSGGVGEPGFMLDQGGFSPLGGVGYASNSSSSSSLLSKTARPYSTASPRRFMPDSTDPQYAQTVRPSLRGEYNTYPTPALRSTQPSPVINPPTLRPTPPQAAAPSPHRSSRSGSRSSSLTRDGHKTRRRSITASTSAPPGTDMATAGVGQGIPTSNSTGALGKRAKEKKAESEAEEEVYTSAAAAVKDMRRRRRV